MYSSPHSSFSKNNYLTKSTAEIKLEDFDIWTSKIAYRTSYNDMTRKVTTTLDTSKT